MFNCCFSKKLFQRRRKSVTNTELESMNDAPKFSLEKYRLNCKAVDVYDGDTITVIFPFAGGYFKHKLRLAGIDTPEIRTKNAKEKVAGIKARNWLRSQILHKIIHVVFTKEDKYGRLMGWIYRDIRHQSKSINQELIDMKMAYAYNGKKKQEFGTW